MLTSIAPGTDCRKNNTKILKSIRHKNLHVKILDMEDSYLPNYFNILNLIDSKIFSFKKCCKRLFHQRYFNVDNKYCMLGCVDMDDDIYSHLQKSKNNITFI